MHLPILRETHHIMNDTTFGVMKDGSYFINTARGALVDEKALCRALKSNKLRAAATDVFEQEPVDFSNPLFGLSNFIATPHTAAETYAVYENVGLLTAQALLDIFKGIEPRNRMN